MCTDPTCATRCLPVETPFPCKTCGMHYRLDSNGRCQPCKDPACMYCDAAADKCTHCIGQEGLAGGPIYDLVNGTCRAPKCGFGCIYCARSESGKPTCRSCIDGLTPVEGQCQPFPNYNAYCRYVLGKCFDCNQPYALGYGPPDAVGNRPRTCVLGVRNCLYRGNINKPSECTVCKDGYGPRRGISNFNLVVGGCVRCAVPRCTSCSWNATKCDSCVNGYSLVNNTCVKVKCPSGCGFCTSPLRCGLNGCLSGHFDDRKGGCVLCIVPNCSVCYNKTICYSCNDGFVAVNGTCVACKRANCKTCEYGPSTCSVCQPGWGADGAGGCINCAKATGDPNCSACGSVSPTICEGCRDGAILYFDTQGRRRCLPCKVRNCSQCFFPTICQKCAPGYELQQNGTCIAG